MQIRDMRHGAVGHRIIRATALAAVLGAAVVSAQTTDRLQSLDERLGQIFESSEFGDELTPELRQKEERLREQVAAANKHS